MRASHDGSKIIFWIEGIIIRLREKGDAWGIGSVTGLIHGIGSVFLYPDIKASIFHCLYDSWIEGRGFRSTGISFYIGNSKVVCSSLRPDLCDMTPPGIVGTDKIQFYLLMCLSLLSDIVRQFFDNRFTLMWNLRELTH